MAAKERLDILLVRRGLAPTRKKAQALIMSGQVLVADCPVEKAGAQVSDDAEVRLRSEPSRYVGRGGDKLEGALTHFNLSLEGAVALDVGASTGGFTDCMLQHGCSKVYAVDVGYNQLAAQLRADPRVVVLEKTHAVQLEPELFEPPPSFATIDVSFISLRKVLAPVLRVLKEPYQILALVKPQFELGREHVGKGGVVRDQALQQKAVELVAQFSTEIGLELVGSSPSVLRGEKKGNQEHFVLLRSCGYTAHTTAVKTPDWQESK